MNKRALYWSVGIGIVAALLFGPMILNRALGRVIIPDPVKALKQPLNSAQELKIATVGTLQTQSRTTQ